MEERIIRRVTEIGNGAHIFAPKEWLNDEVELIRIPRKNIQQSLIELLYPHLSKIIAVFLYGSYARDEQDQGSDLDVFIISNEKFHIKSGENDIIVVPEDKIEIAKKLDPIMFYSMIQEAKPIINLNYLEKLKKEKINFNYFKDFIKDTKRMIKINRNFIELDKLDGNKDSGENNIYSLILRLKGVFIINLLLKKEKYSKRKFKEFLVQNSNIDYDKIYKIYRAVRDNKKEKEKVKIEQAESLLSLLIQETRKLEKRLK